MGLLGVSRRIILEPFWRRLRRVGSSGRLGHRKVPFDSILVVFWVTFGVFLECLGMFFSELFVCIGLYGCRVFEAVSYVFYDPFL